MCRKEKVTIGSVNRLTLSTRSSPAANVSWLATPTTTFSLTHTVAKANELIAAVCRSADTRPKNNQLEADSSWERQLHASVTAWEHGRALHEVVATPATARIVSKTFLQSAQEIRTKKHEWKRYKSSDSSVKEERRTVWMENKNLTMIKALWTNFWAPNSGDRVLSDHRFDRQSAKRNFVDVRATTILSEPAIEFCRMKESVWPF